jgi:hypothetical protein
MNSLVSAGYQENRLAWAADPTRRPGVNTISIQGFEGSRPDHIVYRDP